MTTCPCGSPLFEDCCGPIIAGAPAPTAEALVRSRYSAFALHNLDYVEKTHAPEIRQDFNRAEAERLADEVEWKGLRIHSIKEKNSDNAEIEYVVRISHKNKISNKASASSFRRENGEWFFLANKPAPHIANLRTTPKVGRNDPCPCQSGKKYKKCCASSTES